MLRFFLFVVLPLLVVAVLYYNRFVSMRNAMRHAFSSIDVQLKRRWDLIPNLVETVKGFAKHEKSVMKAVVAARKAAPDSRERFVHEGEVEQEVGRLLALAEDYPELQASDHFVNLQRTLTEVESQISASRRAYNAAVTDWNTGVESFPGVIMARACNFQRADWFEAAKGERKNVEVAL